MPNHLKLIVSAVALAAAVVMFWVDTRSGAGGAARWVALALGPVAVFAIWVFPEAKAGDVRREAARRKSGPGQGTA